MTLFTCSQKPDYVNEIKARYQLMHCESTLKPQFACDFVSNQLFTTQNRDVKLVTFPCDMAIIFVTIEHRPNALI